MVSFIQLESFVLEIGNFSKKILILFWYCRTNLLTPNVVSNRTRIPDADIV